MASTVWRGFLTFGLVSLPVRLFRAARSERVPLRQVARPASAKPTETLTSATLAPVRQLLVTHGQDKAPKPVAEVSKGYEYRKDEFVEIPKEELKQLRAKTSSEMVIGEFVALSGIDPLFFESSYYVSPEEVGEKAYALLFRCLQKSGLVALAQVAMHGREHVIVLRSGRTGLIAHTMFYLNEVHAQEEFVADASLATDKELNLATQLIESLTGQFDPAKYSDAYHERLTALIEGKLQSLPEQTSHPSPIKRQVVDISEALQQSLKNLKKPAAVERSEKQRTRGAKATG